jgi:hypothetical protein
VLLVHGTTTVRSAEAKELFERVKSSQSSRGTTFLYARVRTQITEFADKGGQRLRPLSIQISSKSGRKELKLKRNHSFHRIRQEILSRWIRFHVQRATGGAQDPKLIWVIRSLRHVAEIRGPIDISATRVSS